MTTKVSDIGNELHSLHQFLLMQSKVEKKNLMNGENRQLLGTGDEEGDRSLLDMYNQINILNLQSKGDLIQKIEAAIHRLNTGQYGICARCDVKIHPGRLVSIPFAIFCRDCQIIIDGIKKG